MEKFGIYCLEDAEKVIPGAADGRYIWYRNAVMICNNEDEDGGGWGAAGAAGPYVVVEVGFTISLDNPDLLNAQPSNKVFYILDEYDESIENPTLVQMCKLLNCTRRELKSCIDEAVELVLDTLEFALENGNLEKEYKRLQ